MGIGDTGISPSYKVPRFIAKILMAAGIVSAASQQLSTLLVGMKSTAGSMTADQDVVGPITSEDQADAYAGIGSPLARMAYQALKVPGAKIYLAAYAEPSSGSKATITITIGGSWTTGGTLRFRFAGVSIAYTVPDNQLLDTVGAGVVTAFNAKSKLPATAAYASPVVTVSLRTKGVSGKDQVFYYDATDTPAGMTVTVAGSATLNTNGFRFGASSTGTGTEDDTTILTKLQTKRYARIAVGHNDATNEALWESQLNTQAGPLKLLLSQAVMGHNGTVSQATTLSQTTMNAFRMSLVWLRNSEHHPAEIAALVAAVRSVTEQTNPVPDYDGYLLASIAPQAFDADIPTDAEQDQALQAGCTPLTTVNGEVRIVRMVCSYCLDAGGAQDERCLDIGDPVFTDYATLDLKALYETDFRPRNPTVGPNPAADDPALPDGVGFPDLWNSLVVERMEDWFSKGWTEQRPVGVWAPISVFIKTGKYIGTDVPLPVRRIQHRLDAVIRQTAA